MEDRYFIAVKMINYKNKEVTGYYGEDPIGYVYFAELIDHKWVRYFSSLEDAKEFLANAYVIVDGKLKFKHYCKDNLIGFPKIVKLTMQIEDVYELT